MDQKLYEIISSHRNIVFFGGAGVSTASGIPDFRSADGLYSGNHVIPPETILSHTFFMKNTDKFYEFYRSKMIYPSARPNACHKTLAKLEADGKLKAVVTQNIDGLHQQAGSKNVFELHGTVHENFCMKCGKMYSLSHILSSSGVPVCSCGGIVKPKVVLYEEPLYPEVIEGAVNAIAHADVIIIGGTSLTVYPAASFINYFRGDKIVLVNKSETSADSYADLVIHDDIAKVFEL